MRKPLVFAVVFTRACPSCLSACDNSEMGAFRKRRGYTHGDGDIARYRDVQVAAHAYRRHCLVDNHFFCRAASVQRRSQRAYRRVAWQRRKFPARRQKGRGVGQISDDGLRRSGFCRGNHVTLDGDIYYPGGNSQKIFSHAAYGCFFQRACRNRDN